MEFELSKHFRKQYKALPAALQDKVFDRLRTFLQDPFTPALNNHLLSGKYQSCHSINITGDYRAIYLESPKGHATFLVLGTHAQLYK